MTFEEFFNKKKIDLDALQKGEPALFSEFKTHYEQMGEKSFDHTKKYWFNKLRLRFPAPPEVKAEKVIIENKLAEQTITDTLTEQTAPSSKLGFTPKFRAGNMPKPVADTAKQDAAENTPPAENTEAKPTYKPRFNMKNIPPKKEE